MAFIFTTVPIDYNPTPSNSELPPPPDGYWVTDVSLEERTWLGDFVPTSAGTLHVVLSGYTPYPSSQYSLARSHMLVLNSTGGVDSHNVLYSRSELSSSPPGLYRKAITAASGTVAIGGGSLGVYDTSYGLHSIGSNVLHKRNVAGSLYGANALYDLHASTNQAQVVFTAEPNPPTGSRRVTTTALSSMPVAPDGRHILMWLDGCKIENAAYALLYLANQTSVLLKYSDQGTLVTSKTISGSVVGGNALAFQGVHVDDNDNVYTIGLSVRTLPDTTKVATFVVTKYASDLSPIWSTAVDCPGNHLINTNAAIGRSIQTDPAGNVYVGVTLSYPTGMSIFKLSNTGELLWANSLRSTKVAATPWMSNITIDPYSSSIYVGLHCSYTGITYYAGIAKLPTNGSGLGTYNFTAPNNTRLQGVIYSSITTAPAQATVSMSPYNTTSNYGTQTGIAAYSDLTLIHTNVDVGNTAIP